MTSGAGYGFRGILAFGGGGKVRTRRQKREEFGRKERIDQRTNKSKLVLASCLNGMDYSSSPAITGLLLLSAAPPPHLGSHKPPAFRIQEDGNYNCV